MGLKGYLSSIGLGTFLAWFAWMVVLFNVNPADTGVAGLVMFYVTLSIALIGTLTIIMSTLRVYILKRKVPVREIRKALRHSVLFSIVAVVSLALSAAGKFHSWHVILLVAAACVIEYFFMQFHRERG